MVGSPSQTQTLLSLLQLAISRPSLLHSTPLHSLSCPSRGSTASHSPPDPVPSPSSTPASSTCCQIPTVESNEAVARVAPVGLNERERTVRAWDVGMVDWWRKRYLSWESAGAGLNVYRRTDLSDEHEARVGAAGDHDACQTAGRDECARG